MHNRHQNGDVVPRFPALASCLLVDASHKSKTEIKKTLIAIDLFEEIVIADSVQDAILKLSSRPFDACFIGPSLSPEMGLQYSKEFREASSSSDCAIVAVTKEGVDQTLFSEADTSFSIPCSKRAFFGNTVRAILKANKNSVWPGVRLTDDDTIEFNENGIWRRLDSGAVNEKIGLELDEAFVISPDKESIDRFCDGIQHTPKRKIEKIIVNLLSKGHEGVEDPFVTFFVDAVKEWKEELDYCTLKEASINLRRRLVRFTEEKNTPE
jgi:hypothetical protein